MTSIENIAHQFDEMVPAIAADYTAWVSKALTRLIAMTPAELGKLPHSFSHDGGLWRNLRRFTTMVDENGEKTNRFTNRYVINDAYLAKCSNEYAQGQVDAFKSKLVAKLVDLTNVTQLKIGGLEFSFRGELGAHRVYVEQTTVLKCSNKGTLFNQWPCRIYVDGKFMSEAAFKKLAA